jgi:hypothetical protein
MVADVLCADRRHPTPPLSKPVDQRRSRVGTTRAADDEGTLGDDRALMIMLAAYEGLSV